MGVAFFWSVGIEMSELPFFLAFVRNGGRGEAEKRAEEGGRESDDKDVRRIVRFT